jgi:pimeloyl-ACP methyl ester carboxylesterase
VTWDRRATASAALAGHRGGPPLVAGVEVSVAALADNIETRLDAAGIGTGHLVGNSLGGWIALELARRGRGHSVVVLCPRAAGAPSAIARRSYGCSRPAAQA